MDLIFIYSGHKPFVSCLYDEHLLLYSLPFHSLSGIFFDKQKVWTLVQSNSLLFSYDSYFYVLFKKHFHSSKTCWYSLMLFSKNFIIFALYSGWQSIWNWFLCVVWGRVLTFIKIIRVANKIKIKESTFLRRLFLRRVVFHYGSKSSYYRKVRN